MYLIPLFRSLARGVGGVVPVRFFLDATGRVWRFLSSLARAGEEEGGTDGGLPVSFSWLTAASNWGSAVRRERNPCRAALGRRPGRGKSCFECDEEAKK